MDACFETWIDAMAKWYHVQLVANLVMIRIDGVDTAPEGVQPALERTVLDGCPVLVGAALRKLERPVAPEVVEVIADRAMALRLTQVLQGHIGEPTLAVCRLVVAKPYAPCVVWWNDGSATYHNDHLITLNDGDPANHTAFLIVRRYLGVTERTMLLNAAIGPVEHWIVGRSTPWSLTADEVGKLLEHGATT